MLLRETSPITSTVFVVQSVRETKEYIARQLLLISFSFVSLWHDCPFFWIFVSNPKSDSHVMLGLKLNSIRPNFNNHQKKKKKEKSSPQVYQTYYKMKEGGWYIKHTPGKVEFKVWGYSMPHCPRRTVIENKLSFFTDSFCQWLRHFSAQPGK